MSLPTFRTLTLENRDAIAILTVNRPDKLNALNAGVMEELRVAALAIRADESVRAAILTGAGDKAFVAGADIQQFTTLDAAAGAAFARTGQHVFSLFETCPKPVIAAVNGYALGGGCELAMACHVRIASEKAKFGQPEVKLGIIPGYGGSQRLVRLVGKGRAMELILSGVQIDAAEASRIGLVNRVVPAADLMAESEKLARTMMGNGPKALAYAIQAVNAAEEASQTEGSAHEATLFGMCFATADQKEGAAAFLEKRAPRFQNK